MKRINQLLEEYTTYIEDSKVKEAMLYSLLLGGKRIRPQLLFDVLKGYGIREDVGNNFAVALEMIHTYSLIHDDLPAMDNDDYRRGNLTCHKKYNEATAILAGDALLTEAFNICTKSDVDNDKKIKCISILASKAGSNGMILGQELDMEEIEGITNIDDLFNIHIHKTGCLLEAPLMMASILAEKEVDTKIWEKVGENLGLAFQIQDDILDVTENEETLGKSASDVTNNKVSVVSLLGIEKATSLMDEYYDSSIELIKGIHNFNYSFIMETISLLTKRHN